MAREAYPLCVDLDGTLIRTDMLHESVLLLLKRRPWLLFALAVWLLKGRAYLKRRIAEQVDIDLDCIPLNEEFCAFLREERARRRLGLFSASDDRIVQAVARRLGLFEVALGSDGRTNLSGANKLARIVQTFGSDFVYAGNCGEDCQVWHKARGAIIVGRPDRLRARVQKLAPVEREFVVDGGSFKVWVRALRLHQWAKNLLMFVPLVLAAPVATPAVLPQFAVGFLIFGLLASSTYLLNDLLDLHTDRQHRSKRLRPLASGEISIRGGVLASATLGILALALLWLMPLPFVAAALVYLSTTIAYSFVIKRLALLDVLCLGFLFTLRIYGGTVLIGGPPPYWLFAFSMFFFLSLALVKRSTELLMARDAGWDNLRGRGYRVVDLPVVQLTGIGSAISAIVLFLIYLGDEHFNRAIFSAPHWLSLTCATIAYWLLRIWLLAGRNEMHDDPILFALRDTVSLVAAGVVFLSLALAW